MTRVAILGTGLMGTSIGLALRAAGHEVTGWDPDGDALGASEERGAIVAAADSAEAMDEAAVVILAAPVEEVLSTLGRLDTGALVTDIAGVKVPVMAAAAHLSRFVGGHPMAGRERSGPAAADAALLRGAAWVLCGDDDHVAAVGRLVEDAGAHPVRMSAEEHDRAVAAVSHLPHVLAAALLEVAEATPGALDLAAGGFRDLTRVASSEPSPWLGVLTANAGSLRDTAAALHGVLDRWLEAAGDGNRDELSHRLAVAQTRRDALAPPVVAIRVPLDDRPGELARVGEALAGASVDIRDLQLRHDRHGGGGLLTLSVRPGDDEALRAALRSTGFEPV